MDWMTELIRKDIDEGYSNAQIAADIREEIKERRPYAYISPDRSDDWKNGQNQDLSDYDNALGISDKKGEPK